MIKTKKNSKQSRIKKHKKVYKKKCIIYGGGKNLSKYFTNELNILFGNNRVKRKSNNKLVDGIELFKNFKDINEHFVFMRNISLNNKWRFENPANFGSCFYIEKSNRKTIYKIKPGCKISDVMKSWLSESISMECRMAIPIFLLLKIYRIYREKIDLIIKDITCDTCKSSLGLFTIKNLDDKQLLYTYNNKYYLPQGNKEEIVSLLDSIDDNYCAYLRSQFGYIGLDKQKKNGYKFNIPTSAQGHNIFILGDNRYGGYSTVDIYAKYKNEFKNQAGYLIWGDIEDDNHRLNWINKCRERGIELLYKNKQNNNLLDMDYIIQDKKYDMNDLYGIINTYKVKYLLPYRFKV